MQSLKNEDLPKNPRERSNFFSAICFWYTIPTFIKGRKVTLGVNDLFRVLKEHKAETLGDKLCTSWQKELKTYEKNASLLRVLFGVFGQYFVLLGVVLLFLEAILTMQPIFLMELISSFSHSSPKSNGMAYVYAGGVILGSALKVILMNPYSFAVTHLGLKIRVGVSSMVYRKSLRLTKTELGEISTGHIMNLVSNDLGRMDTFLQFTHYLWLAPLQTLMVTYFMYQAIGIAAVFGMTFMLLFIPFQMYLGNKISELRLKTALRTDKRMRIMTEIIAGIQVIKMYAWELPFEKLVAHARHKEVNAIRHVAFAKCLLYSFNRFLTPVSIFLSLVGFVLLGRFLTAEVAFLITAYYNVVRTNMTVYFSLGMTTTAETLVSIQRVQTFLLSGEVEALGEKVVSNGAEEVTQEASEKLLETPMPIGTPEKTQHHSEDRVSISELTAKWITSGSPDYTLSGVNLQVPAGTLLAIVGHTGSGKSSVIQAILGELRAESGEIELTGSISYAAQEPWLFSGTVRQNILFGQPMDRRRYDLVVRKCALERDFELLPLKDKTILADRGASLSGGQKARISLARSVYRDASIYLLDDPLSAVDSNVARRLFEDCLRGYLRDKTVILVTNQLQFLQQADQIVIMEKGRVRAVGTYESLHKSGVDFGSVLVDPVDHNEPTEDQSMISSMTDQRRSSVKSVLSNAESCPADLQEEQVINLERQHVDRNGLGVYIDYFRAGGGFLSFSVIMSFFVCSQGLASLGDYFLATWVSRNEIMVAHNDTTYSKDANIEVHAAYIFMLITVLSIIVTIKRSFLFFNLAMKASIQLHNSMFRGISRASMYFFNTNPAGGILNRFSKDMGQVDEMLPSIMMTVIQEFLLITGNIMVISIVNPLFLIPALAFGVVIYYLRSFYLKTSRDVKRLEASTRSPVYSHLAASLNGLTTIRAFGAGSILEAEFDSYQDMHSSASYMFISTSRAFAYWMDTFCVLYIVIVTLAFFIFPPSSAADVGLAITQAMGLTSTVQWAVRQSTELENTMISVERVIDYEEIEAEGALEAPTDEKPPESWPEHGKIEFDDLSLRYKPYEKTESVLKSLSFVIKPREKVGIVGRTGAGKSSLINALFRLSYNYGSVLIDDKDTSGMGLHDLRSKISIIPQEPVLFSGTLRHNLDPFDEYSDEKLWCALEEVELKDVVSSVATGLETKITEGGSNFSVGQRQLVCLARAILRDNRILVMDEATANVDPQTDALIQATIRNKFRECTVITVAHRLHTIMDSDRVLVMDAGRVVELATPFELLTAKDTNVFHDLVKQTGQATYDALLKISQQAFENCEKPSLRLPS
ncbi:probable multidrug resistance-associated protein lethal(2)03659 [Drosophila santomea]|uniref:probable multidrug resistance-associated protein lethal(2)03659 n=1 Tax=Drosophila santomea TaxID=129105 RepID=UPI001953DA11|nr:probable multidrug resistance-associated protein lethal(2)03659 [Drosophila santomea]XP_039479924.1 probable multidrug resistance-associated protein lethal(2)03659 [Drosophila santomea]XP_039479925.1 probable multidrug resistance-associated protein lethal(2)03659 [Drosophila santomea]